MNLQQKSPKDESIESHLPEEYEYDELKDALKLQKQLITEKYGMLNMVVRVKGENEDDPIYYEGAVQLYVEPTFGKSEDGSLISRTEAEELTDSINGLANTKLDKVEGEASLLKISTNATLPEHAVRKDYVDEADERKIDRTNDTAKDLKVEKTATDDLDVVNKRFFVEETKEYVKAAGQEETAFTPVVITVANMDLKGRNIAETFDNLEEQVDIIAMNVDVNKRNSLEYKKTWIEGKEYHLNDIVIAEDGNLYICTNSLFISQQDPSLDSSNWELLEWATRAYVQKKIEDKKNHFVVDSITGLQMIFGLELTSGYQNEYDIGNKTSIEYKGKTYDLTTGDVFYIIATDVPDYWVDLDNKKLRTLEGVADSSTVVDLSNYATINMIPTKVSELTNDENYITESASITGNAATATNATNDSEGKNIIDTYAKKTEVPKITVTNGVLEITF